MPTYNNLDTLLEHAVRDYLKNGGVDNPYHAVSDLDLTLPAVICSCSGGEEFPMGSGNFWQNVTVKVISPGNATDLDAHKTYCAQVFDLLLAETFIDDLNTSANGIGFQGFRNRRYSATSIEDRKWVSEMTLDLLSCATEF